MRTKIKVLDVYHLLNNQNLFSMSFWSIYCNTGHDILLFLWKLSFAGETKFGILIKIFLLSINVKKFLNVPVYVLQYNEKEEI